MDTSNKPLKIADPPVQWANYNITGVRIVQMRPVSKLLIMLNL